MNVAVEEVEGCKRKIAVRAPAELVQQAWERAYGRVQKQARLPGFRKGHVPRSLVKLHFASDVRREVAEHLIPDVYKQAIAEARVDPVNEPDLQDVRLEEQLPATDAMQFVEGQQRVPQVVKNPHEQNQIESLPKLAHLINREPLEIDVQAADLGGETGLGEIQLTLIDAQHTLGAPAFHLEGVEPGVASDVENGLASEISGDRVSEAPPLHARVVAEKMVRGGPHPGQIQIVKPRA